MIMPALNKGTSTYHSINALYWRTATGDLLAAEGSNSSSLSQAWPQVRTEILSNHGSWRHRQLPSGKHIHSLHITAAIPALDNIRANFPPEHRDEALVTSVAELQHPDGLVLGLLTSRPESLAGDAFAPWAETFILLETQFRPFAQLSATCDPAHRRICERVADLFERTLKNASRDDQWHVGGRAAFLGRVYGFVERDIPILLALPAFPCKSPNPNKVGGTLPDLAEHMALDVLHGFIQQVRGVYQPGATLWVISDGHVFSDCIGVDDDKVDTYDARLIEIYQAKHPPSANPSPLLQFKGLKDLFTSNPDLSTTLDPAVLSSVPIPHPVPTVLTPPSELCRKLLLAVSGASRPFIRSCIDAQDPHALQLYRGQTRFMLEDLAALPSMAPLSNKQRKKTAARVAGEMMARNQAYSNLVELLLPNYVRLSIHAHDNAGPKFAVRLLPSTLVRAIADLGERHEPVPAYEFQIPTPWHNAIVRVEGDEMLYLARAGVARGAVEKGTEFEGCWVEGEGGAYFHLRRRAAIAPALALCIPATEPVVEEMEKKEEAVTVVVSPVAVEKPAFQRRATIVIKSAIPERCGHGAHVAAQAESRAHSKTAVRFRIPVVSVTGLVGSLWGVVFGKGGVY